MNESSFCSMFLQAFGVVSVLDFGYSNRCVFFFFNSIFIYLAAPGLSCSFRDLVPSPGIELRPPALGTWSQPLDHQLGFL